MWQKFDLSPTIFNLCIEKALKEIREETIGGVKVGRMPVRILRFTDDIAVITESEEGLTNTLEKINDTLKGALRENKPTENQNSRM